MVCSEVIYKSYEGALTFTLVPTAGRMLLPPNEIVRKFDVEKGTDGQELDFVCFLEGRESKGIAVDSTEASFRDSHARSRWDFVNGAPLKRPER